MRNLSNAFRREIFFGDRNYDCKAVITLTNNEQLVLTNTRLWANGFNVETAVSEDTTFTALGSTIVGSASITIDNMDDAYSVYDFTNAKVVLSISRTHAIDGSITTETIRMGTYTVDEAAYNGALIILSMLDNMEQFDRAYSSSTLEYPATLNQIVRDACLSCGVTLNTYTFPHENYVVTTRPNDDAVTFREIIGWAATIAGCFATCDVNGRLELKWFDTTTLENRDGGLDGGKFDSANPYATGDSADGGSFNPWNTGYDYDAGEFSALRPIHYISNLYSQDIGIDDIVITGISITIEEENESGSLEDKEYFYGQRGYIIKIEGNPFITPETADTVGTWLSEQLVGLRFRNANVTHPNDPSIEAGDIGVVVDRKDNEYPILITRSSFSAGNVQTTVCGAESALRNSATRYSQSTRSYVDARKLLNKEQTAREQALQNLSQRLDAKSGLYSTLEQTESGTIYYLHDKPLLEDSMIVWKMTTEAWGVSTDGGETWNGGMTVDGDVIARILNAIGVDADWINAGAIFIAKLMDGVRKTIFSADYDTQAVIINAYDTNGNKVFGLDSANGIVDINAHSFTLQGQSIADIAADEAEDAVDAAMTKTNIFNKLTDNGTVQGIFLRNGKLYLNWTYGQGGAITIKDTNNNTTFYADSETGQVDIRANSFTLQGSTIAQIAQNAVDVPGSLTQQNVFNALTNDGQTQGIFLKNGRVYLNWDYAEGDALTIGGDITSDDYHGYISVLNAAGVEITKINANGIQVGYDTGTGTGTSWSTKYITLANAQLSGYYYGNRSAYVDLSEVTGTGVRAVINASNCYEAAIICNQIRLQGSVLVPGLSEGGVVSSGLYHALTLDTTDGQTMRHNYIASSSKRYKNIKRPTLNSDIEEAYNVDVVQASYKPGYLVNGDRREGTVYPMFIAEQMYEHLPIAVDLNEKGECETWNERVLIPIMFQMIKEQKRKITELEDRLAKLEEFVYGNKDQTR